MKHIIQAPIGTLTIRSPSPTEWFSSGCICVCRHRFEMVDMADKLTLTSLLLFLPPTWQMGVGMIVVVLYMCAILLLVPYVRQGDDQLQLLAQIEIFLLLLAGLVLQSSSSVTLDPIIDVGLSIIMIAITVCIMLGFIFLGVKYLRYLLQFPSTLHTPEMMSDGLYSFSRSANSLAA